MEEELNFFLQTDTKRDKAIIRLLIVDLRSVFGDSQM